VDFLTQPLGRYERRGVNDLAALRRHIRKGDVLLVEGDQRISAIIKYLTQSSWSHAALYVGDEMLQRGGELATRLRDEHGDEAERMLVEALPQGVVATPLAKYVDFNIRVVRPHRLRPEDHKTILDDAIEAVGWRYDIQNIIDLLWYFLPAELVPRRLRPQVQRLGSEAATEVICSSLLGELFGKVRFPVLPRVTFPDGEVVVVAPRRRWPWRRRPDAYPGLFQQPHPSTIAPRDFDLSPYFEVVKFNVIADGDFDYQRIRWAEKGDYEI
jgi:hypothetical protein